MTPDDIIKMAREANIKQAIETPHLLMVHELERFAALVAAHEREACAKVCEERQEVFQKYYTKGLAGMCAEAIRARSEL
jgi:hypothetical protein